MMEGWATDSQPAQFEVAAQELSAKYQSGVQSVGHGQTGQGSMSLQVLLPAVMACRQVSLSCLVSFLVPAVVSLMHSWSDEMQQNKQQTHEIILSGDIV